MGFIGKKIIVLNRARLQSTVQKLLALEQNAPQLACILSDHVGVRGFLLVKQMNVWVSGAIHT